MRPTEVENHYLGRPVPVSAGSGVHNLYGTGLVCCKLLLRACLCLVLLQMDTQPFLGQGPPGLGSSSSEGLLRGENTVVNVCKKSGSHIGALRCLYMKRWCNPGGVVLWEVGLDLKHTAFLVFPFLSFLSFLSFLPSLPLFCSFFFLFLFVYGCLPGGFRGQKSAPDPLVQELKIVVICCGC